MNFPTDVYVLEGIAETTGNTLEIIRSDGVYGPLDALESAIDENTALVSLSHTAFESGYTYDIAAVTEICHRVDGPGSLGHQSLGGCRSHRLGRGQCRPGHRLHLQISQWRSGFSSVSVCANRPSGQTRQSDRRVVGDMQILLDSISSFNPSQGSDVSTRGLCRSFHLRQSKRESAKPWKLASSGSGPSQPHSRSFLSDRLICTCPDLGISIVTPREADQRGSHVSIANSEAWPITQAVIGLGKVIPDYRTPDNLRLGVSPLYTSFVDVHTAIQRIRSIVSDGHHHHFADTTTVVT